MLLLFNGIFILAVLVWVFYALKLKSIQNYSTSLSIHIIGVMILAVGAVLTLAEELNIITPGWWDVFLVSTGLMIAVIAGIRLINTQYG